MLELTAHIEIKSANTWTFDKVVSLAITRDMDALTDTCTLTLPKKVKWQGEGTMPLRRGDEIRVWLGYDGNLQMAFAGFITTIGLKTPVEISCEDYMFRLKQQSAVKKAYRSVTIEQLLKDQNLPIRYKVFGEQTLGQYRVTAGTVTELLSHLKEKGGIRSFVRIENGEPVLYAGVLFDMGKTHRQVFATGVNLIDDTRLKVGSASDVKIKVKAISLMPDNKKVSLEVGDDDGRVHTLNVYNKTEKELKPWAEQELRRLKGEWLTGSLTTFGGDLVDKLDNVGIKIDGQRKGIYQVRKNVIKYGAEGFRQEITIGERVAE